MTGNIEIHPPIIVNKIVTKKLNSLRLAVSFGFKNVNIPATHPIAKTPYKAQHERE